MISVFISQVQCCLLWNTILKKKVEGSLVALPSAEQESQGHSSSLLAPKGDRSTRGP